MKQGRGENKKCGEGDFDRKETGKGGEITCVLCLCGFTLKLIKLIFLFFLLRGACPCRERISLPSWTVFLLYKTK
jgi:hypothetical protein